MDIPRIGGAKLIGGPVPTREASPELLLLAAKQANMWVGRVLGMKLREFQKMQQDLAITIEGVHKVLLDEGIHAIAPPPKEPAGKNGGQGNGMDQVQ